VAAEAAAATEGPEDAEQRICLQLHRLQDAVTERHGKLAGGGEELGGGKVLGGWG